MKRVYKTKKLISRFYSSFSKNKTISPIISYSNADTLKLDILSQNKNKIGIYMWTNKVTNKSYIGSAKNISNRLKNYYNISYLQAETIKNKSIIYRSLLKYGYSNFSLDILEYCDFSNLIKREQYYIDLLKPEYNILKAAGSMLGFKHDEKTIQHMSAIKLGRSRSEAAKLAIAKSSEKSQSVIVTNNNTGDEIECTSIRKAAKYTGLHHSYLAKVIKINNIYIGKNFTIKRK